MSERMLRDALERCEREQERLRAALERVVLLTAGTPGPLLANYRAEVYDVAARALQAETRAAAAEAPPPLDVAALVDAIEYCVPVGWDGTDAERIARDMADRIAAAPDLDEAVAIGEAGFFEDAENCEDAVRDLHQAGYRIVRIAAGVNVVDRDEPPEPRRG